MPRLKAEESETFHLRSQFYGKTVRMEWIYLSPHLDDVALSCGGLVWEQAQAGNAVGVWTICAGDPPGDSLSPLAEKLHARWGVGRQAPEQRRLEDIASCAQMGASYRHYFIPDCIYRLPPSPNGSAAQLGSPFLYTTDESIMGTIHTSEEPLVHSLTADLAHSIPPDVEIVCPLALGGHVDHRLTRRAAEQLGRDMWYYMDYPYLLNASEEVEKLAQSNWKQVVFPVSQPGFEAWERAVAAHVSQLSTFWPDPTALRASLKQYLDQSGGVILWRLLPGYAS